MQNITLCCMLYQLSFNLKNIKFISTVAEDHLMNASCTSIWYSQLDNIGKDKIFLLNIFCDKSEQHNIKSKTTKLDKVNIIQILSLKMPWTSHLRIKNPSYLIR